MILLSRNLSKKRLYFILLAVCLICLCLLLRLLYLGNAFQSSDNAKLAVKVLRNHGYLWMIKENYGIFISLFAKYFTGLLSFLGITVNEFWWKAPTALFGAAQVPLTFLFLRKLNCSKICAFAAAAAIAILPIHVMQSRYLWGYEVLGVFFITLAIWKLIDFFYLPTIKNGLTASLFLGLYLIAHGYIIPFMPSLLLTAALFNNKSEGPLVYRCYQGITLLLKKFVWAIPVLLWPIYSSSISHTFRKQTKLGFFLKEHLAGFIENTGIILAVLILYSLFTVIFCKKSRENKTILFMGIGTFYLLPFLFGTPTGITITRGYMLIGTYFLLLCAITVFDKLFEKNRRIAFILFIFCFATTLWGTVNSIFFYGRLIDLSGIKIERGDTREYGIKACAYIARKYLPSYANVLFLHRSIEPTNAFYYFKNTKYSRFDLTPESAYNFFLEKRDICDAVIAGGEEQGFVDSYKRFTKKTVIYNKNSPSIWIFTTSDFEIPIIKAEVSELNRAFDQEYSWRVSLF